MADVAVTISKSTQPNTQPNKPPNSLPDHGTESVDGVDCPCEETDEEIPPLEESEV